MASVSVADIELFLGRAYARLYDVVAITGAVPTGPPGARYATVVADEPQPVEAYVPIGETVVVPGGERDVVLGELPATEAAVLVHRGPFEECAITYRTLGAWVARHATHADEPVRELYLLGPDQVADAADYRTEIVWPIVRGSSR